MYIAIIFLTGIINMFLQAFSRNIIFFYVFAFCTISAIALSEYKKKIGKFITAVSILSFVMLFFISLYLHTLYGGMINDYNIVMIEAPTMVLLTAISILPIKNSKNLSSQEREVLLYMEQRWTIKQVECEGHYLHLPL